MGEFFVSGKRREQNLLVPFVAFCKAHWYDNFEPGQALDSLDELCKIVEEFLPHQYFGLLAAGQARGGDAPVGGITWQDWNLEFKDELPFPQIVGHTQSPEGARQKGRSWCLDGGKTC